MNCLQITFNVAWEDKWPFTNMVEERGIGNFRIFEDVQ